jgi:predicted helicase
MSKLSIAKEIAQYIAEINRIYKAGNATEHSYRPALKSLLENLTSGLTVINEPRRIDCGAPDYIAIRNDIPVGYIEAKDIDTDLNHKTHKLQFDRYKQSLSNLIITDYLTFQLFVNSDFITSVTIAKTNNKGINPLVEANKTQFDAFATLIGSFAGYEGQPITTSLQLSKIMAAKARLLAKTIEDVLVEDANSFKMELQEDNSFLGQFEDFKKIMQHNMSKKEFADIYAQTIAYGMFAAKLNDDSKTPFNRIKAAQLIPHSNPFLRQLFQDIAGFDPDEGICWIVDDLANLFNSVSIDDINNEFEKNDNDAMIHFYETFLAEYDPALRKSRGVWYTPQPVVKFIVQAVDDILRQEFNVEKGLASNEKVKVIRNNDKNQEKLREYHRVQILDPATGTGTFLAEVVQRIFESNEDEKGVWDDTAVNDLIPRINGFEILMASYAMAHLKLDMLLQKTGYKPSGKERLRIYLTNSLEEPPTGSGAQIGQMLSKEAKEASRIKQDIPVMVVLGNPPYSGESQNKSPKSNKKEKGKKKIRNWIERLLDDYKKEPVDGDTLGRKLEEKNSKWINDDYVKFIRFGQHFIEKNKAGILAYITNHSFLDNPTFRGMRWNLLKTFDKIYILDLHGNAKKKETAPDGGKDENVFDIQQGVSINIFIKTGEQTKKELAQVFHADLYGKRFDKYNFLNDNTLQTVQWRELELSSPQYFFVQKDFSLKEEYEKGFKIQEMFPINSVGVVTGKDAVFVNRDRKLLLKNVQEYLGINPDEKFIQDINYRPFDAQHVYYDTKKIERARIKTMQHFLKGENIALVLVNRSPFATPCSYIFITKKIISNGLIRSDSVSIDNVFPLYLHPENKDQTSPDYGLGKPNLKLEIVKVFAEKVGLEFEPEKKDDKTTFAPIDLLDYIYAVLYSPTYRERYKEFLKIDFPRVPYPENAETFWALVELGGKLRRLHLMENIEPQEGMATYPVGGSHKVEKLKYEDNKVYINDEQYFDNIPSVAWNFYIGGYQPAQKWLKDRKGRKLDSEDVRHYRKMIRVLVATEEMMKEINEIKL